MCNLIHCKIAVQEPEFIFSTIIVWEFVDCTNTNALIDWKAATSCNSFGG